MKNKVCTHKIEVSYYTKSPDNLKLTINFNFQISDSAERFLWPFDRNSTQLYLKKLGDRGKKLVAGLMEVEGITAIQISKYQVVLEKADMFVWKDKKIWESVFVLVTQTVPVDCADDYDLYTKEDGKIISIFRPL